MACCLRCRCLRDRRLICNLASTLALITALFGPASAQANWFKNSEQEAIAAYEQGDFSAAAAGFSDPFRRGVALYRAGRYAEAEAAFAQPQRASVQADADYNLGNARFAQGDYAGAISAYEQVLSAELTHDDALHNLALARSRLARVEQEAFAEEQQPGPEDSVEKLAGNDPQTQEDSASEDSQDSGEDTEAEPKEDSEPSEAQEAEPADQGEPEQGDQQQDQQERVRAG